MSAKGRDSAVVDSEFYPTPAWCTRRILEALPPGLGPGAWLEPCCGEGAISSILNTRYGSQAHITASDIRDVDSYSLGADVIISNSGFTERMSRYDVVITNPPFSLAPELIAHFLPRCDWLILLLRSAFKLSAWRGNMPDEYRLPQRPEFVASEKCVVDNGQAVNRGCGWSRKVAMSETPSRVCPKCAGKVQRSTTDASEYSWFVWTPERNRSRGALAVLPDTPLAERVRDRGA